jgi:SAM-dependent methyltransferase
MGQISLGRTTTKFIPLPAELGRTANYKFDEKKPIRDVPYVPTPEHVVQEMIRQADVTDRDVVYDLGCGDGRIVICAAELRGARGVGVDIDPQRIDECKLNAIRAGVSDRVQFVVGSAFKAPLQDATVVALYLLPWMTATLRPKLLEELRPGSRIIAHQFPLGHWSPDRITRLKDDRVVYLWTVPADVKGTWQVTLRTPDGALRRGMLMLEQEYQAFIGIALLDGREWQLDATTLAGDRMIFTIGDVTYHCRVTGDSIRGEGHRSDRGGALEVRARRQSSTIVN